MSIIKNPLDSLQDYFNDLLDLDLEGNELGEDKSAPSLPLNPPKEALSNSDVELKPTNKEQPKSIPTSNLQSKPIHKTTPEFADPDTQTKEKLQKLLQSAPPEIATASVVKTEVAVATEAATKTTVTTIAEIQEWVIETPVASMAAPFVAEVQQVTQLEHIDVVEEIASYQLANVEWMADGRPAWAQSRFDVLLFQVSGLTLAVPLIALGQIQHITDELTPLFGQADWFMGIQPTPSGKIRAVNTAKFVMPERYSESFLQSAKLIVTIDGVPWGLAVDSVTQPISIEPEGVKWRVNRSKRPWLAGTVKEHMCALLDIPMIGNMLMSADKNLVIHEANLRPAQ